ncbi:MAG: FAD binding domain-containing protein [Candidatus Tectomicrobia bacterium]|uniref:FAD binding domain-containing protein n=1 Tax=Tectimicrobiota bacterium TaxID=2528274 RepID=A0A932MRZ9_UNCTE|nr:FAD binding domain-containing protein [Candidatus Tectomicrobia bacterium]
MRGFDFAAPTTIQGILKAAKGKKYKFIAGGTNFLPDLRHAHDGLPQLVIDISRVDALRGIALAKGEVRLGALTTMTDLLENKIVAREAPILPAMAAKFAGPIIRNRASVAGNLIDGGPAADAAPPLLALKAVVRLAGPAGKRAVPLDKFLTGYRKTAIKPGEIITEIAFPAPGKSHKWGYYKLARRNAMAITVVGTAVVLKMKGNVCQEAGISLGSVNPAPIRCNAAEKILEGKPVDLALAQKAAEACRAASAPIDDIRASAEYRKLMCEVLPRRLICQALNIPLD